MQNVQSLVAGDAEQKWTKVIEEARQFPDGVAAYCKVQNISKRVYYDWFARLRAQHPEWQDLMKGKIPKSASVEPLLKSATPPTEVRPKSTRRTFSPKKKKRILQEIDEAPPGGASSILRREGIYSSHIQKWRAERDSLSLTAKKRGPKADPQAAEIRRLRAQNERLEKKLLKSQKIIELQKKVSELLGLTLEELPDDE